MIGSRNPLQTLTTGKKGLLPFKSANPLRHSSKNPQITAFNQDHGTHYTRKKVTQVHPMISLPFDLVCLIMSKVGAKSSKDVFKYRICCKVMKVAGESSEVYRELDVFGILKLPCLLDKRDETLNKCRQHENLLLMFRDAMATKQSFKRQRKGQKDVIFMNVMLLLVESMQNKEEALKVLNDAFRGSGRTNEIHQILSRIGGLVFGRQSIN